MTRTRDDVCPVKGCLAGRYHDHMMCWPHWRRVPKLLRNGIWDTFKEWKHRGSSEARVRYFDLRAQAIAAVEAKEAQEALT